MTVTLYARSDIKEVLIADGVRTWTDVRRTDCTCAGNFIRKINTTTGDIVYAPVSLLAFAFADEGHAMAFRLRYSDHLLEVYQNTDCDDLMALEVA